MNAARNLCCAALLVLAGCTVVRVQGASRVSGHFGILRIEPDPGAALVSYRTAGIGLVPGPAGLTVGAAKSDVALAFDPSRCQAVVFEWPGGRDALVLAVEQLKQIPDVCRVGEKNDETHMP